VVASSATAAFPPSGPFPGNSARGTASSHSPSARNRFRAFSLLEILLALFILTIGLVILATVFPIAGDWTRQATEHTIAQSIARNAVALIQSRMHPRDFGEVTDQLSLLRDGASLTKFDHAYNYGYEHPIPIEEPRFNECLYFWQALVRQHPFEPQGAYDLYILVFKKGETSQHFSNKAPGGYAVVGSVDLPNLWLGPYRDGTEVTQPGAPPNDPRIFPPVGDYGIGSRSGTVFRQRFGAAPDTAAPNLPLVRVGNAIEPVFYAAPASGTNVSPLVYVYHTIVTF
jgi:hypothetical protein